MKFQRHPLRITVCLTVLLTIACLFYSSCRKSGAPATDNPKPVVLPASGAQWVSAENSFSFDLFHAVLLKDTASHNVMISPLSIYMALGMTDNGAAGSTRDSIDGALRLGSLSLEDFNANAKALISELPSSDPQVNLSVANSIWYNQTISPLPSFLQATQENYNARVAALNFSSPSAVVTINQWVAAQTQQMIKSILDQISSDEILFLVNAVYFKGSWTYQFDASATKSAPFTLANGAVESAPLMTTSKEASFDCFVNDSLTMVDLPYGGGDFRMLALLPGAQTNIHTLASGLNAASLAYWESKMNTANIQLYFPKFNFSYSLADMTPELSAMGMRVAFQTGADFSDMYTIPVQISRVVHKTAIQVDETGTKASAATVIGITETDVPNIMSLLFDHPFVFVIQEKTSGVIIFLGILHDPNDQQ